MSILVQQRYILRYEPREVDTTKFVHEFRAATLECTGGQRQVELLLTPFHNHDTGERPVMTSRLQLPQPHPKVAGTREMSGSVRATARERESTARARVTSVDADTTPKHNSSSYKARRRAGGVREGGGRHTDDQCRAGPAEDRRASRSETRLDSCRRGPRHLGPAVGRRPHISPLVMSPARTRATRRTAPLLSAPAFHQSLTLNI